MYRVSVAHQLYAYRLQEPHETVLSHTSGRTVSSMQVLCVRERTPLLQNLFVLGQNLADFVKSVEGAQLKSPVDIDILHETLTARRQTADSRGTISNIFP